MKQGMEETQAVHKQEIDEQVAAHKTALRSLIGPNHEYNTLPSPAQHAARMPLRNEIAMMIRTDLRVNTADERWSRRNMEQTYQAYDGGARPKDQDTRSEPRPRNGGDGRTHSINRTSHNGKKRRNERLDNKEIEETIQQRITKIENEAEAARTAEYNRSERDRKEKIHTLEQIQKFEEIVEEQEKEIFQLQRRPTIEPQEREDPRECQNPRMAAPDRMATPDRDREHRHDS
jgi:hypothetical protein